MTKNTSPDIIKKLMTIRSASVYLLFLTGICFILSIKYVPRLSISLSLDELASYWAIHDGLTQLIIRSTTVLNQSPFYYFILWTYSFVAGASEVALRLPSLVFITIATFFIFYIAKDLFSINAAVYSSFIFLMLDRTAELGTFARPYALAMLLLVASVYCLIQWVKLHLIYWLLFYWVTIVSMLYCHPMYMFVLPCHIVYILTHCQSGSLYPTRRQLVISIPICVLSLLPLCFMILRTYNRSDILAFAPLPTPLQLVLTYCPFEVVTAASVCIACHLFFRCYFKNSIPICLSRNFSFIASWYIFPPLLLYIVSHLTGTSVFVNRYCSSYLPAIAILIGMLFNNIPNVNMQRVSFCGFICIYFITTKIAFNSPSFLEENWREATKYISSNATNNGVILLSSGYVEARNCKYLEDSTMDSYISAPLLYYHVPYKFLNLPLALNSSDGRKYFITRIKPQINYYSDVWILFRRWLTYNKNGLDQNVKPSILNDSEFKCLLGLNNFKLAKYSEFGAVGLAHFTNSINY